MVFHQYPGIKAVAEKEQDSSGQRDLPGQQPHFPAEAESCRQKSSQEHEHASQDDFSLYRFLFASVQSLSKEFRTFPQQKDTQNQHRKKQDRHQEPRIEPVNSSRREKKQSGQQ